MHTAQNRTRFWVKAKHRDELTQFFPYRQTAAVEAYVASLQRQGWKPKISRTDDAFEVRIRQKGFPHQNMTFISAAEAEKFINTIASERARGLFIAYTDTWKISFASLIALPPEKAPKHKSFEMEAYQLNGLLEDASATVS